MDDAPLLLCARARDAADLPSWRRDALGVLAGVLPFDVALFHELSPRVPLERGALVGLAPDALEGSRRSWDEHAVVLGRLRDLALRQDGVATDREAFPVGSRGRRAWQARVARPLGLRSAVAAHLVLRGRIGAVILLGRRSAPPFGEAERLRLASLVPALTVGDALHRALGGQAPSGPPTELACLDQRLTPRQREVVVQVALGRTNAEIGLALGISPNTVRNLLVDVRRRLGAANRAEIVRLAVLS